MTALTIDRLAKRFGETTALDEVSLHAPSGGFLALLGPSGCGKTTLLRLLAGFEEPSLGSIRFDGREVSGPGGHLPPERRRVAMVFQSYALWPHMSLEQNVAYPLSVAGTPRREIGPAVERALAQVGLKGLGERRIEALSGGQRQRVALARALVQDAPLVLCDEPLANLDVHLRASMIDTFRALHRETGRSFVYVTHDQGEALALATEIAVLDRGRLAQLGAPEAIYGEPASAMVAGFVGRGTLLDAELSGPAEGGAAPARVAGTTVQVRARPDAVPGPVRVLVRPENLRLGGLLRARIVSSVYRGASYEVVAEIEGGGRVILDRPRPSVAGEVVELSVEDAWAIPNG